MQSHLFPGKAHLIFKEILMEIADLKNFKVHCQLTTNKIEINGNLFCARCRIIDKLKIFSQESSKITTQSGDTNGILF